MKFPRSFLASLVLAISPLPALAAADRAADPRPNIIVILADDLGYGDLGCYGQKLIQTPHLDAMAAEGLRFTQFYSGSTVCAPARGALMTGLHVGHATVRSNQLTSLHPGELTVARLLQSAGYATGLVGKWGLGETPDSTGHPNRQGFDYFFGFLNQVHAHNSFPDFLWRNGERVPLPNVVTRVGPTEGAGYTAQPVAYAGDVFNREALQFIEQHRDQPFFLYYASTVPHANNERTRSLGDGMEAPDLGAYADRPWPEPNKKFAAAVSRLDADVGRVLARLRELKLDRQTLVLFLSDNGPHQEGGQDMALFDSNGSFRGIKRDLYEGGIRIPALAWWPGRIAPRQVSPAIGHFADLLLTAAQLAGLPAPTRTDGQSLVSVLDGQPPATPRPLLYWEFNEPLSGSSQAVLLDGRWKALRVKYRAAPLELYDLTTDPGETTNVAAAHPEIIARAEAALLAERSESPTALRDPVPAPAKSGAAP